MKNTVKTFCKDIKIQHTLFALPFAVMSSFLAADGLPSMWKLALIIVALTGVRSAAMAFNRIVDNKFDQKNPRTQNRALPSGNARVSDYIFFLIISLATFEAACYMLNPLALKLSPIAIFVVFFYSFTKRFTVYSHFVLGIALGIAPVGAWVAIKEEISLTSLIIMGGVIFWLAGLDIIYSCQDADFDRLSGLFSIPARLGIKKSLQISTVLHIIMVMFMLLLFYTSSLGFVYLTGILIASLLLSYEHAIVTPEDMSKVNVAFFNVNGLISLEIAGFTILDLLTK